VIALLKDDVIVIDPKKNQENISLIESSSIVISVHSVLKSVIDLFVKLKGKVKTLTIQDGIIEYKHSSHNFQGVYRYRPLASDKILVFGNYSKRLIIASGTNENDIIITGSPRFDLLKNNKCKINSSAPILITMSNRPGYGKKNILQYYKVMADLLNWLEFNKINFKIRLSRGVSINGQESLNKTLSDPPFILKKYYEQEQDQNSIYDDFKNVSAIITTPSTISLEAMIYGLPVVHLLTDATTVYSQSAWIIRNSNDFKETITSLCNPNKMKLEFQNSILKDNISFCGKSANRIKDIINELIAD
jgi:hypothetical protein